MTDEEQTQEPARQPEPDMLDKVTDVANSAIEKAEGAINSAEEYAREKTKNLELTDNAKAVKEAVTHPKETVKSAVEAAKKVPGKVVRASDEHEREYQKDQEFRKQKYRDTHGGQDEPVPTGFEVFSRGLSRTAEKSYQGSTELGARTRANEIRKADLISENLHNERIQHEKKQADIAKEEARPTTVADKVRFFTSAPVSERERKIASEDRIIKELEKMQSAPLASTARERAEQKRQIEKHSDMGWLGLSANAPLGSFGSGIKPGRGSPLSGTAFMGGQQPTVSNNVARGNNVPMRFNVVAPDFARPPKPATTLSLTKASSIEPIRFTTTHQMDTGKLISPNFGKMDQHPRPSNILGSTNKPIFSNKKFRGV